MGHGCETLILDGNTAEFGGISPPLHLNGCQDQETGSVFAEILLAGSEVAQRQGSLERCGL